MNMRVWWFSEVYSLPTLGCVKIRRLLTFVVSVAVLTSCMVFFWISMHSLLFSRILVRTTGTREIVSSAVLLPQRKISQLGNISHDILREQVKGDFNTSNDDPIKPNIENNVGEKKVKDEKSVYNIQKVLESAAAKEERRLEALKKLEEREKELKSQYEDVMLKLKLHAKQQQSKGEIPSEGEQQQEHQELKRLPQADNIKHNAIKTVINNVNNSGVTPRPSSCNGCFPHNLNYVINPILACHPSSPGRHPEILIMISSTAVMAERRKAIRKSWASKLRGNTGKIVRYVFLFGRPRNLSLQQVLLKESAEYGDILQEDFAETYKNLTLKTMSALKWATQYCSSAKFVMKTDDDMFIHIPNLLLRIQKKPYLKDVVFGACTGKGRPIRNERSKYYASYQQYPEDVYHGFCSGTGYVIPMKITQEIVKVSPNVPFFHLEDVYIGLCVHNLGHRKLFQRGFHAGHVSLVGKAGICSSQAVNSVITIHYMTPTELMKVWDVCKMANKWKL